MSHGSLTASLTTSHCQMRSLKWVTTLVRWSRRIWRSSVVLIEPSATPLVSQPGQLVLPDQHVPAYALVVPLGEGDELVGRRPVSVCRHAAGAGPGVSGRGGRTPG